MRTLVSCHGLWQTARLLLALLTSCVVVSAPGPAAAADGCQVFGDPVATPPVVAVQAVIGTNVTLTPGTPPAPSAGAIVMNPDGTITVAPNTTPGTYDVPYRLCTVPASTPATCLDLTARVTVAAPAQPTAVPTLTAWALILLGTLVGGLGVRYHRLRI